MRTVNRTTASVQHSAQLNGKTEMDFRACVGLNDAVRITKKIRSGRVQCSARDKMGCLRPLRMGEKER